MQKKPFNSRANFLNRNGRPSNHYEYDNEYDNAYLAGKGASRAAGKGFRTLVKKPDYSSSEFDSDSGSDESGEDEKKSKSKGFRTIVVESSSERDDSESESESEEQKTVNVKSVRTLETKLDRLSSEKDIVENGNENESEPKNIEDENEAKQSKAKTTMMQKTVRTFLTKPIVTDSDQDYANLEPNSKEVQPMKTGGKAKSYRDIDIEVSTGTNTEDDPTSANEQSEISDLPQNLGGRTKT
jgi:hypothetical protein